WLSSERKTISLKIIDKELLHTENGSRLNALVQHQGIVGSYSDIDIYAVISDITGKPVGISQTYIKGLIAGDDKNIFFTWPISLKEQTAGLCENRANLPTELLIPSDIMLVFDRSGSMNNDSDEPPQPISDAKEAAKGFADRMLGVDRVGLVSFATEASFPIDQGLTYEPQKLKQAIDNIVIGIPDNEQHTNLGDGIKKALEELEKNGRDKAKKAIIALTDGVASRPFDPLDPTNEAYAEDYAALQADQALKQDTLLYVIGLGEDINNQLLTFDIASSPEKFYQAVSSEELSLIYTDIAQAVCEEDVFLYEIYIRISDKDTL
ncbi:MAG: VWA domain-containing protein, partial [Candidatus Pacebacteria bacterium]|nr:VWA domain-containing protein [Candidatus Paceibacterota bacterium]